ncbi:hypothetical protein pdam_00019364 [Pocillopora damicornis]|uniref:Uncharacterized protein n=1 Tax=Pocillopora damicornis TaxID=46731 RepID=A0A3M6UP12_POCDA|nr:hypothetical protein pdam_00019364 [Pocillopora damicornis]
MEGRFIGKTIVKLRDPKAIATTPDGRILSSRIDFATNDVSDIKIACFLSYQGKQIRQRKYTLEELALRNNHPVKRKEG